MMRGETFQIERETLGKNNKNEIYIAQLLLGRYRLKYHYNKLKHKYAQQT